MNNKSIYSDGFKEQALVKVYSRGDRTIQAVAEELNLNKFTLKSWMKNTPSVDKCPAQITSKRPQDWRPEEPTGQTNVDTLLLRMQRLNNLLRVLRYHTQIRFSRTIRLTRTLLPISKRA